MLIMPISKEKPEAYFARYTDHIDNQSFLVLFDFDDDPEEREWTTSLVWSWVGQHERSFTVLRELQ